MENEGRKRPRADADSSSDGGGTKRASIKSDENNDSNNRDANSSNNSNYTTNNSDDGDWDEDLHKLFVSAIYEVGLRNSSPAVILENMAQKPSSITSERIKSKLQKYRNNKDKSKQEFMDEYTSFLHRAHAIEGAGGMGAASCGGGGVGVGDPGPIAPVPAALLEMMGSTKLLGGDAAAYLSYAVLKERGMCQAGAGGGGEGPVLSRQFLRKGALEYVENFAGAGIPFPELTTEEKTSSLGVSMTFVMGLFLSMTQHLASERANNSAAFSSSGSPQNESTAAAVAVATGGAEVFQNNTENFETMQEIEAAKKRQSKVSFSLENNTAGSYPQNPNQNHPHFTTTGGLAPLGIVKTGEATGERTGTSPIISPAETEV